MITNSKCFSLLMVLAAIAILWESKANANLPSTSSEELYSESIFIEKSSAEVPGALESNARSTEEADLTIASYHAIESIQDLDGSSEGSSKKKRR